MPDQVVAVVHGTCGLSFAKSPVRSNGSQALGKCINGMIEAYCAALSAKVAYLPPGESPRVGRIGENPVEPAECGGDGLRASVG